VNVGGKGHIDKEIIRRIVQRHIGELKDCYERELVTKRRLGGEAILEFTISTAGEVDEAHLRGSTLRSPRAESCMVAAIRTWGFPYPHSIDGETVSYPFHFIPGSPDWKPTAPATPARP
jgi:TonB family protein